MSLINPVKYTTFDQALPSGDIPRIDISQDDIAWGAITFVSTITAHTCQVYRVLPPTSGDDRWTRLQPDLYNDQRVVYTVSTTTISWRFDPTTIPGVADDQYFSLEFFADGSAAKIIVHVRNQIDFTGVTGVQGITGLDSVYQGPTGVQGETGLQGAQGDTGIQGPTGAYGGPPGQTGIQGQTGIGGQTGIQGLTGQIGIQGQTGIQGPTGIQGQTGLTGQTGVQGQTGIQGQTGVQGETGISYPPWIVTQPIGAYSTGWTKYIGGSPVITFEWSAVSQSIEIPPFWGPIGYPFVGGILFGNFDWPYFFPSNIELQPITINFLNISGDTTSLISIYPGQAECTVYPIGPTHAGIAKIYSDITAPPVGWDGMYFRTSGTINYETGEY